MGEIITPKRFLEKVFYAKGKEDVKKARKELKFDEKTVMTVGNHSYISLNIKIKNGDPDDLKEGILNLLDIFEKFYRLEITNWFIEKTEDLSSSFISGLWITHRS